MAKAATRTRRRARRRDAPAGRHRFVVQRHRASTEHYDFRIETGGVLISWAVPKRLTLDPAERRTGVRVDDHPIEYFDFEGVIPAGQYGAGDVIVWDWGTYDLVEPDTVRRGVHGGRLEIELHGERLRGTFLLERRRPRGSDREEWLMKLRGDGFPRRAGDGDDSTSVKSGRTSDEVRAAPSAIWQSGVDPSRARIDLAASEEELLELDALENGGSWRIGGHDVKLSNLDKVLFPAGITKRDLIRYYASVAPFILPHLRDRAVNLHRYPDGVGSGKGFWQKDLPARAPTWITRWRYVHRQEGPKEYAVVDRVATLVWLAQEAAVELHPWTSRTDAPELPTHALVDIDPGDETTWDEVLVLARLFRTALDHLGLIGVAKVTGRRGIQVSVPIERRYSFEETRTWVERLSRAVGATVPELVSWKWSKRARSGLARLDYTQNAINRTVVVPYSVRSSPAASVATPIRWDELDDPELRPDRWTIATLTARLDDVGDLFADAIDLEQTLPAM